MNYDNVIRAAALLKGDPRFEEFLGVVTDAKEQMESELESFDNVGNHAVMAFIVGQISLCKKILEVGQPIDEQQ